MLVQFTTFDHSGLQDEGHARHQKPAAALNLIGRLRLNLSRRYFADPVSPEENTSILDKGVVYPVNYHYQIAHQYR